MGKALVIKGADFSVNSVEQLGIAIPKKRTGFYVFFLDYNGSTNIQQAPSNSATGAVMKLLVADVEDFVGEDIKITAATPIVASAYYACFTASLGDLQFDDISTLGSSGTNSSILHAITSIESFNVSTVANETETVTKTVPSGAKYLIVTGNYSEDLTDAAFKVIPADLA